jgi:OmpA-OmpF porin, OOP family
MSALAVSACASTSTSGGASQEPHGQVIIEGIRCYFLERVHFMKDAARVEPESREIVTQLATAMTRDPGAFVFVELAGYASRDEPDAVDLSLRRAVAVRDAVVALGVDPARLRTKGYGAHCPLAESADEAYKDRRVEAKVLRTKDGETGVELGCTSAAKAGL